MMLADDEEGTIDLKASGTGLFNTVLMGRGLHSFTFQLNLSRF